MNRVSRFVFSVFAAVALLTAPAAVEAQQSISVDFSGGVSFPESDLDFQDPGGGFSIGVDWRLHELFSVRFEGGADLFEGDGLSDLGVDAPDFAIARFSGGGKFHALRPVNDRGIFLDVNAGAGLVVITMEETEFQVGPGAAFTVFDISKEYFSVNGGADVGYQFTPSLSAFIGGDVYVAFADEDDWEEFASFSDDIDPLETVVSIPIQAGVKLTF